jgi:transcriptional regulator with XRE-family HTH domain
MVAKKDIPRSSSLEVARLLRKERIHREISLNRLAEKAGLSRSMVSYVERGMRNPTLDTLFRIASALDVDLWRTIKRASNARR